MVDAIIAVTFDLVFCVREPFRINAGAVAFLDCIGWLIACSARKWHCSYPSPAAGFDPLPTPYSFGSLSRIAVGVVVLFDFRRIYADISNRKRLAGYNDGTYYGIFAGWQFR